MFPIFLILHDVRSSENVGAIFRTADAAGVSRIYLTGYTPGPLDRFGRANARLAKASLGAEKFVAWEKREDAPALIGELKAAGVRVVAVEQDPSAVSYMKPRRGGRAEPTAFIFGNEVEGVPRAVMDAADAVVEIPMRGKKESLNVSAAAAVILFSAIQ